MPLNMCRGNQVNLAHTNEVVKTRSTILTTQLFRVASCGRGSTSNHYTRFQRDYYWLTRGTRKNKLTGEVDARNQTKSNKNWVGINPKQAERYSQLNGHMLVCCPSTCSRKLWAKAIFTITWDEVGCTRKEEQQERCNQLSMSMA